MKDITPMTASRDTEFAQWFNRYYGDPHQTIERTYVETNRMIKTGLKLLGIPADETNVSHCRNLLQDRGQIQAIVRGSRAARWFRITHRP